MVGKKLWAYNILIFLIALTLLAAAGAHAHQLKVSVDKYRSSFLIFIETLFLGLLFLFNLINVITVFVLLIMRNFKGAGLCFLCGTVSLIIGVISMEIDAPTLVYIT